MESQLAFLPPSWFFGENFRRPDFWAEFRKFFGISKGDFGRNFVQFLHFQRRFRTGRGGNPGRKWRAGRISDNILSIVVIRSPTAPALGRSTDDCPDISEAGGTLKNYQIRCTQGLWTISVRQKVYSRGKYDILSVKWGLSDSITFQNRPTAFHCGAARLRPSNSRKDRAIQKSTPKPLSLSLFSCKSELILENHL